ncbi:MAG: chloride channel protein [Pirellulaceae bacterium]
MLVAGGVLYIRTFYGIHGIFERIPLPTYIKAAVGALLTGVVGLGYFVSGKNSDMLAVLGGGYGMLQTAFSDTEHIAIGTLIAIALVKIVTTSLTIGSGGSGGVFGPSVIIGGCLGGATGKLLQLAMPQLVSQPGTYAIVGMAGFAGCARAPFSTILMVTEMTGSYRLLLPTMWVSILCFLLMRRGPSMSNRFHALESPAPG